MDAQETLTQIDHIMTEVDLELYEWQEAVDMMSFIGYNASFELWTNDDPPVKITGAITTEALVAAAGKELRVMNYLNGEPTQVGTAVIGSDGTIVAKLTEDVPELQGPVAHFSMSKEGVVHQWQPVNPPFEGLNKPLTIRGLDKIIAEAEAKIEKPRFITNMSVADGIDWDLDNNIPLKDNPAWNVGEFEKHPFFDKEQ
jgi:hypothetical protein